MSETNKPSENENREFNTGPCGGAAGGPGALAEAPPAAPPDSRALSITCPAQITGETGQPDVGNCRVLLAGIETLDFGIFCEFDDSWRKIVRKLGQLKARSRGTPGVVIGNGRCVVLAGGKPNYQFHLQYPGFQLYLSRKRIPENDTPNVLVSLNAELMWRLGERAAVELVLNELSELARGAVQRCLMSRCDMTVDLLLPGGMTDQFVRSHAVTRVRKAVIYTDNDDLQTMYVGASASDILLRIYDKSAEVRHSQKLWFLPLWGLEENANVWRCEFQIRRAVLRSAGINSLDELMTRRGDLWKYLTADWFSLRLADNENVTRRTVHPLWQLLQGCTSRFGPTEQEIKRSAPTPCMDPKQSVKQAASSLVGFATRAGVSDCETAIQELAESLRREFQGRNFTEECQRKAVQLGMNLKEESK